MFKNSHPLQRLETLDTNELSLSDNSGVYVDIDSSPLFIFYDTIYQPVFYTELTRRVHRVTKRGLQNRNTLIS